MDDSDHGEDVLEPKVTFALEYVNGYLNFYIKYFSNVCPLPSCRRRRSRAVIYVAVGLNRTTWMGRIRAPTSQELSTATKFKTLPVQRETMTIFNEFFSCPVRQDLFEKTMIRVQFCDVDKKENEIVIGECDLWPFRYATNEFREFLIPVSVVRPDLGELEMTIVYLPTAQRICVDRIKATNLKLDPLGSEVYCRLWLFTYGNFDEIHKTEPKLKRKEEHSVYSFNKRLIFDLLRIDLMRAILIVQAVELVQNEKRVIGQFGMSATSPLCEQGLWRSAMKKPREQVTAIMRLSPGC